MTPLEVVKASMALLAELAEVDESDTLASVKVRGEDHPWLDCHGGTAAGLRDAIGQLLGHCRLDQPQPTPTLILPIVATSDAAHLYAKAVVDLINDLTGRYFKVTAETVTRAKALLRARIKVDRMLAIVRFMAGKWSPDPKMREYVQPSTLMRVSNAKKYGEAMDAGPARGVGATAGFKMLGDE